MRERRKGKDERGKDKERKGKGRGWREKEKGTPGGYKFTPYKRGDAEFLRSKIWNYLFML